MTTSNQFVKKGNEIQILDSGYREQYDKLPTGIYALRHNPMKGGYYLEISTEMVVPDKLYGNTKEIVKRFLSTAEDRPGNTGILLNGEKGSGKTLTLRALAREGLKHDLPTVLINQQHCGEDFNAFMANLSGQRCIIAFDEFDKTYEDEAQMMILTLLDGVFKSNHLFVFTCNNSYKVNSFFLNRPGRVYYNVKFRGIAEDAIKEYCEDVLKNKKHIAGVLEVARTVDSFNFDMLKGLVEEMNRYGETAHTAVQLMNIRPEASNYVTYEVEVKKAGVPWEVENDYALRSTNPLAQMRTSIQISRETPAKNDEDEPKNEYETITLTPSDLYGMDPVTSDLLFKVKGFEIKFVKVHAVDFQYAAL